MATNKLERVYTIPLRSDFVKVPKYYRAKRAVSRIKNFISKHMKSEDVRLGTVLNEHVWSKGIKNPPGKVTVKAVKQDDFVTVELEGFEYKTQKVQTEKTEKPTSFKDKLAAKMKQSTDSDDSKDEEEKASEQVEKSEAEAKPSSKKESKDDSKDDGKAEKVESKAKSVESEKPKAENKK